MPPRVRSPAGKTRLAARWHYSARLPAEPAALADRVAETLPARRSRAKLRISNPAPTRTSRASAISATTGRRAAFGPPPRRSAASALSQRGIRIRTRPLNRRRDPEENARQYRNRKRKQKQARIYGRLRQSRDARRAYASFLEILQYVVGLLLQVLGSHFLLSFIYRSFISLKQSSTNPQIQ